MIKEALKERQIPPVKSRREMLEVITKEEYGVMPPPPDNISYSITENYIPNFCAGKATCDKVEITCTIMKKRFTFPVYSCIPAISGPHPFFVCINFRDCVPDRYIPTEEIIDNGFGIISFCYEDVTKDNDDFTDGFSGLIMADGKRDETSPGKIALWAWAAHRAMDYACTVKKFDVTKSIVCGHSRLGKTALLAAATDERFAFAFSNDSGCSGAAIARGKDGEKIKDICNSFWYWFCEGYKKYQENEDEMPFDQHYLVSCIAPRYVYISSASEDDWADPKSEFLTCVAADEVYRKYGKDGFVCEDRFPRIDDEFHCGSIGYHLRSGLHYFSREDWIRAIKFIKKHI